MAASVATLAVIVGLLWAGYPRESLARAVVGHLAEEPQSWASSTPVPASEVAQKLRRAGVRLDPDMPTVTYLQMCQFRGHYVPHFVVHSDSGPVTIMVLTDEAVAKRTEFAENGYRGVLLPAGKGSIAVVARGPQDLDVTAAQALASIHYVD